MTEFLLGKSSQLTQGNPGHSQSAKPGRSHFPCYSRNILKCVRAITCTTSSCLLSPPCQSNTALSEPGLFPAFSEYGCLVLDHMDMAAAWSLQFMEESCPTSAKPKQQHCSCQSSLGELVPSADTPLTLQQNLQVKTQRQQEIKILPEITNRHWEIQSTRKQPALQKEVNFSLVTAGIFHYSPTCPLGAVM